MTIDLTQYNSIFSKVFFSNSLNNYTIAIGLFFIIVFGLKLFEKYILIILKRISKKTKTKLDDLIIEIFASIKWPFFLYIALFATSKTLVISPIFTKIIGIGIILVLTYYGIKGLSSIVDFYTKEEVKKRKSSEEPQDTSFILIINSIVKLIIWVVAILLVLSNLGIKITPLIASVGVGGIAIAFALQNVLQDLFSAFTIFFDKPFQEGDFIIIGADAGVVKYIGLKSTRIKTLQGQELVVANSELTSTRINNYKKMEKRRIAFNFGVEYGTKTVKLKKINTIVKDIFKGIKVVTLDRVHFKSFGDFSLDYEVVYYIDSSDYTVYMDTQEDINLKIKDAFEKEKIEMAFPTQTIHIKK